MTIYKDYLLVEESAKVVEEGSREKSYNHFTNYEPWKEEKKRRDYPVTWIVDQNHKVTKLSANEDPNATADC